MITKIQFRDQVSDEVGRDFFGPGSGPTETFSADGRDTPVSRYMTGILYPQESTPTSEHEGSDLGSESSQAVDADDSRLSLCNAPSPSSFGISFSCSGDAKELRITVNCGCYALTRDASGNPKEWVRSPISKVLVVPIAGEQKTPPYPVCNGLQVEIISRPRDAAAHRSITATLVNTQNTAGIEWLEQSARCFFQCEMELEVPKPGFFVERRPSNTLGSDPELRAVRLLYRYVKQFAVGHGCSASWDPIETDRPDSIRIEFIPSLEIHPLVPPDDIGLPSFSLERLAGDSRADVAALLEQLVDGYGAWLNQQKQEIPQGDPELKQIAEKHFSDAWESHRRIVAAIQLLRNGDARIFQAFQHANAAMLEVFSRSEWQKNGRPKSGPTKGPQHNWHPFQIAFILQCLESLANPACPERDICDLLWFPTGGGKTEAYLGLTAFILFLRRLREKHGGGTSVLMRYTLRLLTGDQFIRAALMICACDHVRTSTPPLRDLAPFTLGLFVGESSSPNRMKDAIKALKLIHKGQNLPDDLSSPMKLAACPWCGEELTASHYSYPKSEDRIIVNCSSCEFKSGIPVAVVDEEIFHERPSLIIGTIDKFARLPWVAEAGSIFSTDGAFPKPDMIIQDELHLISGPLGTIAGLYESAIDRLCSSGEVPVKVIASTATIRNASRQIRALFDRRFAQFPPPLLDARDSYFARDSRLVNTKTPKPPARRYIGLFTPGKSPLTAFIRCTGALLHSPFLLERKLVQSGVAQNIVDELVDPYFSLVSYFNSLRELGGAVVRVHDDVADYLKTCSVRDNLEPLHREIFSVEELYSGKGDDELDTVRRNLWSPKSSGQAYDMILCSNMISVGLDVPRFGLMAVNGQPKTTAEYIQATSRIGRRHPGLVVTLYNWSRSRDRSHYERFVSYHSRIYSEVEATSVTPWSSRARDRVLHAVLVSLVRHLCPGMNANQSAGSFQPASNDVADIVAWLKKRIASCLIDQPADIPDAQNHLDTIVAQWQSFASAGGNLSYSNFNNRDQALLIPIEDWRDSDNGFATMNNMRNVDSPSGVFLKL